MLLCFKFWFCTLSILSKTKIEKDRKSISPLTWGVSLYYGIMMKKINTKYRNNNNNYSNQIYSLNYKFDSSSPAGKFNGTALDLIKKYNELAKDCLSNNDYVEAEVYRQYAEHYRKIVTDINEKKLQRTNSSKDMDAKEGNNDNIYVSTKSEEVTQKEVSDTTEAQSETVSVSPLETEKKEFKIIEIKETGTLPENMIKVGTTESSEVSPQPKKRVYRRKTAATPQA